MAATAPRSGPGTGESARTQADVLRSDRDVQALWPGVRTAVHGRLAKKNLAIDEEDLRSAYHLAWHNLNSALLAGKSIKSPAGYLVEATWGRLIDDLRARSRWTDHIQLVDITSETNIFERHGSEDDVEERIDSLAALRSVAEALEDRFLFSEREAQIARLIRFRRLTRSQVARRLGISKGRVDKIMDGDSSHPGLARRLEEVLETINEGRWCETRTSLMTAFATGLLQPGGRRHQAARRHLRHCAACRARMRAQEILSLLLPPLPLEIAVHDHPRRSAVIESFTHAIASRSPGSGTAQQAAEQVASAHGPTAGEATAVGAGAVVGGGAAAGSTLLGGAGAKLVAACLATIVCTGGALLAVEQARKPPRQQPAQRKDADRRPQRERTDLSAPAAATAPRPSRTPKETVAAKRKPKRTTKAQIARNTREVEAPVTSPAPPESTGDFGTEQRGPSTPPQPARAPDAGGGEFLP